jgi:hypothetical protein
VLILFHLIMLALARRSLPRLAPLARSGFTGTAGTPAETWPVPIFYADWAEVVLPEGHRFPMDKYRACRKALEVHFTTDAPPLRGTSEHEQGAH